MKEPYVKNTIFDLTGGLSSPPPDDGYNIAATAFLPTGPLGKRKIMSQGQFIQEYLTGSKVRPDDNMSILYLYMVLGINPVYVTRACPVTVLEGITSKGDSILFDKAYKMLPSYFKFRVDSIKDQLDYYYAKIGEYCYTSGDDSDILPDEISGATKVKLSVTKSIDAIVDSLISSGEDATLNIIKSEDNAIISRSKIDLFSNNIGKTVEIAKSMIYHLCKTSALVSTRLVGELDYISTQGISYYFQGMNIHAPTSIMNPVALVSPDNKSTILNKYFMLKVLAASNAAFYGKLKVGIHDYVGEDDIKFTSSNVPYLKVATNNLEICGSKSFDQGTLGSHAISVVNSVATKEDLPTTDTTVGNKYIVLADESHAGKKYIYTIVSNTPVTWDEGLEFTPIVGPNVAFQIDEVTYNFVATKEVSADSKVIPLNVSNTLDFLVSVMDYIISHWPAKYASNNTESLVLTGDLTMLSPQSNGSMSSSYYKVTSDTEKDFTYYYYLSSDENNIQYIKYPFLWLIVGNYLYYTGEMPESFSVPVGKTAVRMHKYPVNMNEFLSYLFKSLYTTQQIGMFNGSFVSTGELDITFDEDVMDVSSSTVNQSTMDQFAVVQSFPSTESVFSFSYSKSKENEDILELELNYKNGTVIENWTMSFVPGVVNGFGVDQWYERVVSDYFKVVSLTSMGETGEIADSFSSIKYGNKVGIPDYDVQYLKDAMQTLPQYEDGVYYDMLIDSGVVDPGFASVIEKLSTEFDSIYPASLPDSLNEADLISYIGAANLSSNKVRLLAAADRLPVSGFSKSIPGSFKLIQGILSLFRNKAIEFAPHFDLNHGTVGVSSLIQTWDKSTREKLLDYKIATLKGGVTTPYYINKNVTAQPFSSYMSEDQNVRMTNTAVHVVDNYVKTHKAELNTAAIRTKIQDGCNRVLQDRLFKGKAYSPAMYRAVCDDSNNTMAVINNNQLVVSLYASFTPSIQYILVDHFIVPLDQVS